MHNVEMPAGTPRTGSPSSRRFAPFAFLASCWLLLPVLTLHGAFALGKGKRIDLPAEMRVAALFRPHGATWDPTAALERCEAGNFDIEPMPESHPHVAPSGPHFEDLGFLYFGNLSSPYRVVLDELSRTGADCGLIETARGMVMVRRMMEYPAAVHPGSEVYQREIERQQRIEFHSVEVNGSVAGVVEGSGAELGHDPRDEMALLSGGVFWAGSTEEQIDERVEYFIRYVGPHIGPADRERYTDELLHPVQVAPFAIDRTEVTVDQFRVFVSATGFATEPEAIDGDIPNNWPVTFVNLKDATNYCRWLGKRLPTAAEWEFAARGGESRRFPWGDSYPDGTRANFRDARCDRPWRTPDHDDGFAVRAPVGSFPAGATPEGLFDMAGNVREWCADLIHDGRAMVKSGGYENAYDDMLPADVRANEWDMRAPDIGFRCAADAG